MKTAVQNLIASPTKGQLEKAQINGMTIDQVGASELIAGNSAVCANSECLAIFRDKVSMIAALDRVAQIEETDKGSCYIPTDKLIAAILA